MCHDNNTHIHSSLLFQRIDSQAPDLIEEAAITPDVAAGGESAVQEDLWGTPSANGIRFGDTVIHNVTTQAEVRNLISGN